MTYGETTTDLRRAMIELLRRHRVLQPLGGPGIHTVPESTTLEERQVMGEQIQRFRHATLLWCLQAVEAAAPKFIVRLDDRGPAGNLRHQLTQTMRAMTVPLPALGELAMRHPNVLVEAWRQAAVASALGEHDFPAGVDHTRLDGSESRAVLKDAADFLRGLVVLDRRYKNVPGWVHLKNPGRLGVASEVCSRFAAEQQPDYTVDTRGWRPHLAPTAGPALPGLPGAIQAQHNMLADLSRFPTALNLRRIIHSQIGVAHEAARHAESAATELIARFRDREDTYRLLLGASCNLGGVVGDGGPAAAASREANGRLQALPACVLKDAPKLHDLARICARTDARIASILEQGFAENLYFVAVKYPRLGNDRVTGVVQQRERWVPVTSTVQTDLLPLARQRLRSISLASATESVGLEGRLEYEKALTQNAGHHQQRGPAR